MMARRNLESWLEEIMKGRRLEGSEVGRRGAMVLGEALRSRPPSLPINRPTFHLLGTKGLPTKQVVKASGVFTQLAQEGIKAFDQRFAHVDRIDHRRNGWRLALAVFTPGSRERA